MSVECVRFIRGWYERYGHELYRTMRAAVRNTEEAKDISQEAFLKVAVKIMKEDDAEVIRNPKAFLYRIAYNELYTRYKRKKLEHCLQDFLVDGEDRLVHNITPEQEALSREELKIVRQAIEELPQKQQQAFLMSREENLPHSEIARRLGIKTISVQRHIIRALATLRGVRETYRND